MPVIQNDLIRVFFFEKKEKKKETPTIQATSKQV